MYTQYTNVHFAYRRTLSIQTYTLYTDVHVEERLTKIPCNSGQKVSLPGPPDP